MERGFLWTDLSREVLEEFDALVPASYFEMQLSRVELAGWNTWHVEKPNQGLRSVGPQKTVTERVRDLRTERRVAGLCIDCGQPRDPESKSYCPQHREADRLKAAIKREARRMREQLKINDRDEFIGITHHFTILARKQVGPGPDDSILKEWDGYIHAFEDAAGKLVGIDVKIAKAGSKLSGMMDGWSRMFTLALKHGASVDECCKTAMFTQFEPAGPTKNEAIPRCGSLLDYVGKWLAARYVKVPVAAESAPTDAVSVPKEST